jgi:hypothetical protein
VRVTLAGWVRPVGSVTVCAKPAARIGNRRCRTTRVEAAARPTVELRLPIHRAAPLVRARVQVTVRAADGRVARAPAFVRVL